MAGIIAKIVIGDANNEERYKKSPPIYINKPKNIYIIVINPYIPAII